jgi:hypothetical protein
MNADKLRSAIPRFEQGDEKRRRREYRQLQKARFTRPEPGFSLYEGRTRGKRAKYTFDDGEDVFDSDALSTRRSTRNASPSESGPTVTASGRQVKARVGGVYGESLSTEQRREYDYNSGLSQAGDDDSDDEMPATAPGGRPARSARAVPTKNAGRNSYDGADDDMNSESDEQQSEGEEWSGDENEPDDEESEGDDSDDDVSDDELVADEGDMQRSLVVQLRYRPKKVPVPPSSRARTPLSNVENVSDMAGPGSSGLSAELTLDDHTANSTVNGISKNEPNDQPMAMSPVKPSPQRTVPQFSPALAPTYNTAAPVQASASVPQTYQSLPPASQLPNGNTQPTSTDPSSTASVPSSPPSEPNGGPPGFTSSIAPPTTSVPEMSTGINGMGNEAQQRYQVHPSAMDVS